MSVTPKDTVFADWFLPAIVSNGDVRECLNEVIKSEQFRIQFVSILQTNLCAYKGKSSDSITELRSRVLQLKNTLNFRLGMLTPERHGAWFRESFRPKSGPFASTILSEPIFANYDATQVDHLQHTIAESWRERRLKAMPFTPSGPCIWLILLDLNQLHEQMLTMGRPFQDLRLDQLPDQLPPSLATPSLIAFLNKVREAIIQARVELDECYELLWPASQKLWDWQRRQQQTQKAQQTQQTIRHERVKSTTYQKTADDIRHQFRERRSQVKRQTIYTPADLTALRFMKFEEMPDREDLRKRYLEMARTLHPDKQGGNEDQFKQLTRSYAHLNQRVNESKHSS